MALSAAPAPVAGPMLPLDMGRWHQQPLGYTVPFSTPFVIDGWRNITPKPLTRFRGPIRKELLALLDCTYSPAWDAFRRRLNNVLRFAGSIDDMLSGCNGACDTRAWNLENFARTLMQPIFGTVTDNEVGRRDATLYLYQMAVKFTGLLRGYRVADESAFDGSDWCHYGVFTIGRIWRHMVPPINMGFFEIFFGEQHQIEFLSSSSWPVDYLDLSLGDAGSSSTRSAFALLRGPWVPHDGRLTTPWAGNSGGGGEELLRMPLLRVSVDPQGCTCLHGTFPCPPVERPAGAAGKQGSPIHVVIRPAHVSMTLDIMSMLLRVDEGLEETVLCPAEDPAGNMHMYSCNKTCSLAPALCSDRRVSRTYREPDFKRLASDADVLVCFTYRECIQLGQSFGRPLIVYDGTQYACPDTGQPDAMWSYMPALRELLAHDVHARLRHGAASTSSGSRSRRPAAEASLPQVENPRLPAHVPTVFYTTDPWQAETLFYLTGIRVPSIRPSTFYLKCMHRPSPKQIDVLVHNDRGRSVSCFHFTQVLQYAVPDGYPLRFLHTVEYLSFCRLAKFRAVLLVPHGNVMQMFFREVVNMALPIFLPDVRLLLRQPFYWWWKRMNAAVHSFDDPERSSSFMTPPKHDGPPQHLYPPNIIALPEGPERLRAVLYWMQFLDYFHWPGVCFFASIPDLLRQLISEDLSARSAEMRDYVRSQREFSVTFWSGALARLLTERHG